MDSSKYEVKIYKGTNISNIDDPENVLIENFDPNTADAGDYIAVVTLKGNWADEYRLTGAKKPFKINQKSIPAVGQCTAVYILYFIRILRFVVPELRCVVLVALPLRVFRPVVRYRYVLLPLYADYLLSDFPLEVEAGTYVTTVRLRIKNADYSFDTNKTYTNATIISTTEADVFINWTIEKGDFTDH